LFDVTFYDLKQYVDGKYERVDDKAFGMHGQVLRPDILGKPLDEILKKTRSNTPVIYFSPRGKKLTQS
jgi:tRNA (guanine37-N1)-methyltransferase